MSMFVSKTQTALALGIPNLWRVFSYRMGVKLGLNPVRRIQAKQPAGIFFKPPVSKQKVSRFSSPLRPAIGKKGRMMFFYFSWYGEEASNRFDWHKNPFNNHSVSKPKRAWWNIPDFDPKLGDIKAVWEASRFDWLLNLAQSAIVDDDNKDQAQDQKNQVVTNESDALNLLNECLNDWCEHNPPYLGINWKCGQEASIRVMHLSMAASILDQHLSPSDALIKLIHVHLQRIAPTIRYAVAQDNNHATSEAAALFIGGSWLYHLGDKKALKYQLVGRKWLENRAQRLIASDGTFSQYSSNYHRVMLDTYSMVEYWRRLLELPKFSTNLYSKLQLATNWLYQVTQTETGYVPNLGANDGARLLPLSTTDYTDYRPSVQLASILFAQQRAYESEGEWDAPLQWLNIESPTSCRARPETSYFAEGGYSLLRCGKAFALFNIPRFKFRPSQIDALHVDLWLSGENLLRDAGTYSYNAGDDIIQYFGGTAGHNTIQFDNRDQMPRLSRFLVTDWLKAKEVLPVTENKSELTTGAAYYDYKGAYHHRLIKLSSDQLQVIDTVAKFQQKAVLRWRLQAGVWICNKQNGTISNGVHMLSVSCSQTEITRFEIVEGWESRYYLQKTPLPVLEVEINQAGILTTEYSFNL